MLLNSPDFETPVSILRSVCQKSGSFGNDTHKNKDCNFYFETYVDVCNI